MALEDYDGRGESNMEAKVGCTLHTAHSRRILRGISGTNFSSSREYPFLLSLRLRLVAREGRGYSSYTDAQVEVCKFVLGFSFEKALAILYFYLEMIVHTALLHTELDTSLLYLIYVFKKSCLIKID